jgi:hypothetical protein
LLAVVVVVVVVWVLTKARVCSDHSFADTTLTGQGRDGRVQVGAGCRVGRGRRRRLVRRLRSRRRAVALGDVHGQQCARGSPESEVQILLPGGFDVERPRNG